MTEFITIPCNPTWPLKRARFLFRERRERSRFDDEQLTASQSHGVISQTRYQTLSGNKVTAALAGTENFLHVEPDDFVISLRTFEGGIERAREKGCISPAYTVMACSKEVEPGYFERLLKSAAFISALQTKVTGIRDGKSVKYHHFSDILLPLPDLPTQKAIAAFLARETARIDQLIEKKQRLVELLGERRRGIADHYLSDWVARPEWNAVAHRIVCQPRRPDCRIVKLRHLAAHMTSGSRGWADEIQDDGTEIFLQSGNIGRRMEVDFSSAHKVRQQFGAEAARTAVREGDVLVCITGGRTGAVGYVCQLNDRAYVNQHVCLIRPRAGRIVGRFLAHVLWSEIGQAQFAGSQYGLKQGLGFSEVARVDIPVPPLEAQASIALAIDRAMKRVDLIETSTTNSIDRLKEYRSALITAAVTGQIDVETWSRRGEGDRHLDRIEEEMAG